MTSSPRDEGDATCDAVDRTMRRRFANRSFSGRPVPRRTIEDILEVARFAPSGANIQPWRVYAVAGASKREISRVLLAAHDEARDRYSAEYQYYASPLPEPYASRRDQFGALYYGSLQIERSDADARARQTAKNYGFFGAPVGLIIAINRHLKIGSWLDLGMFIQNVMLAAAARGLQTCPQETFAKYHTILRTQLPIPPEEIVVCGMSIGFAGEGGAGASSLMPKVAVGEFARFAGFED